MTSATLLCSMCDARYPRETFACIGEGRMSGGGRPCRVLRHDCGGITVVLL